MEDTADTIDLTQTETYKNLDYYIQRASTLVPELSNDELWARRSNSIRDIAASMLLMSLALAFTVGILYAAVKYIVLDIIQTSVGLYNYLAPLLLLVIIGYYFRSRRDRR